MYAGKTKKGDCTIDGERARIDFGSLEGDMICGLFHTHTPLTYVSEGHSRETGPSDEANLNLRWLDTKYLWRMRLKHISSIFSLVLLLESCISVNTSGYRQLSEEARNRVLKCDMPIDSLRHDGFAYQVKVGQIADFISNHTNVIVYEYIPYCSSKYKLSLKDFEAKCLQLGYKPCAIYTEYYQLFNNESVDCPVLVIDQQVFGTDNVLKYSKAFFDQLTNTKMKDRGYGCFYVFVNGNFKKAYIDFNDIAP